MTSLRGLKRGDVLYRDRRGWPYPHWWVVLTDEDESGRALLVPLVTSKPHTDQTVVLTGAEYRPLNRPTSVDYAALEVVSGDSLRDELSAPGIISRFDDDLPAPVLDRVARGALASPRSQRRYQDWIREEYGW